MRAGHTTRPTLRRAVELYTSTAPDLCASTLRRMGYEVSRWMRLAGDDPVDRIDLPAITRFRAAAVRAELSPRSIESNVATVRLLIRNCRDLGLCESVPSAGRLLRRLAPAPQPATMDELRRLWDAAGAARWPKAAQRMTPCAWWRAWMALGFWTGLRLTDLTWRLALEHCGTDAIRFRATKTGCLHVYPMTDHLRRIVRQAGAHSGTLLACPRSPTRLRNHLHSLCDAACIRRLTPKNLRQASVTEWSKADSLAGEIVHGCGMPSVLRHYIDPLQILTAAAPRVAWPFGEVETMRQLSLF